MTDLFTGRYSIARITSSVMNFPSLEFSGKHLEDLHRNRVFLVKKPAWLGMHWVTPDLFRWVVLLHQLIENTVTYPHCLTTGLFFGSGMLLRVRGAFNLRRWTKHYRKTMKKLWRQSFFFYEYSWAEAGIATLTYKESGLSTKKIRCISEYGLKNQVYEASLPNLWSCYSGCKYGGVPSNGRETKKTRLPEVISRTFRESGFKITNHWALSKLNPKNEKILKTPGKTRTFLDAETRFINIIAGF